MLSEEGDGSIERFVIEILELVGHVGRHRDRLAVATVDQFLCSRDADARVIIVQSSDKHLDCPVGMFARLGRDTLGTAAWIARLALLEWLEVAHCSVTVFSGSVPLARYARSMAACFGRNGM